ncbi:hypothetical protein WA158_002319 [Blastocystis sp. Blastoise]
MNSIYNIHHKTKELGYIRYIIAALFFVAVAQSIEIKGGKAPSFANTPAAPSKESSEVYEKIDGLEKKIKEQNELLSKMRSEYEQTKKEASTLATTQDQEIKQYETQLKNLKIQLDDAVAKVNQLNIENVKKDMLIEGYKNYNLEVYLKVVFTDYIYPTIMSIIALIGQLYETIKAFLINLYMTIHQLPLVNQILSVMESMYNQYLAPIVVKCAPYFEQFKELAADYETFIVTRTSYYYGVYTTEMKDFLKDNAYTHDYADSIYNLIMSTFVLLLLLIFVPCCLSLIFYIITFPTLLFKKCFGNNDAKSKKSNKKEKRD